MGWQEDGSVYCTQNGQADEEDGCWSTTCSIFLNNFEIVFLKPYY